MVNRYRGEVALVVEGRALPMRLTLGALAELENAFSVDSLPALGERFASGRLSSRDVIRILAAGPLTRPVLLRRLGLNQRGFYRDIELLRAAGIHVVPRGGRYHLELGFGAAVERLPFPDPRLTLGQAQHLARGKTAAHRALKARVEQIINPLPRKSR